MRFDLLSTVSGGGYIGGAFGRLFSRAESPTAVAEMQKSMGCSESTWFGWWLRSNGRYLAPAGAKDSIFAVALYLRNLLGVHFEFALISVLAALFLIGINLAIWQGMIAIGYEHPGALSWMRWISSWMPTTWLLAPIPLAFALNCIFAYWQIPWMQNARKSHAVIRTLLIAMIPGLMAFFLFYYRKNQITLQPSWNYLSIGLAIGACIFILTSCRTAWQIISKSDRQVDLAKNNVTRRLACALKFAAIILAMGTIERLAFHIAIEASQVINFGFLLAGAVIILRALSLMNNDKIQLKSSISTVFTEKILQFLGYALFIATILWWFSITYKFIFLKINEKPLIEIEKQVDSSIFSNYDFDQWWINIVILFIPILIYSIFTGGNSAFLNTSSLNGFYRARLIRAYLGASNASRFGHSATDKIEEKFQTTSHIKNVGEVDFRDDIPFSEYKPHRFGGPIHIINTCVNQTADPEGRLFNRDRKGMLLSVVGGGLSQLSLEGWRRFSGIGKLTLGTWLAISGAAAAPGFGSRTRTGLAALLMFAGVRLGYWLTRAKRNDEQECQFGYDKPLGLLRELGGNFSAGPKDDWFLSDGGHFENTGAYALLAARSQFIVLADCGADPGYGFFDLENLVRKARIDLGARIDFQSPHSHGTTNQKDTMSYFGSLDQLASPNGNSCLALARITYAGEDESTGILVIIKPNLCRALPMDVMNYRREFPGFPQESTGDQFFSEAQWESYFSLGCFIADKLKPDFIQELLSDPSQFFCPDTDLYHQKDETTLENPANVSGAGISPDTVEPETPASAKTSRISPRINVNAVGATLGIGAVAAIAIPLWQAVEKTRTESTARKNEERKALKELSSLWAKVENPKNSLNSKKENSLNALAAEIVQTADSLCKNGDAQWLQKSRLGMEIVANTVEACKQQAAEFPKKTSNSCRVLLVSREGPKPTEFQS